MKPIAIFPVWIFAAALLMAGQGTVPPNKAAEFRNRVEVEGTGLGVAILNESQVKQRFVSDLGRDYLVVEVGLYPKAAASLELQPEQFVLRVAGQERALRSENPKVIAASLQKDVGSKRDITVIPHAEIGYESGRRGYDPRTGTYGRNTGGIYTSTGVGVLLGDPTPGADPKNEEVMALELSEKGLPAGTFTKPVAGFLYFRVGKATVKDTRARFELGYQINGEDGTLALKR